MTNRQLLQLKKRYIKEGYKLAKRKLLRESSFYPFDEGDYVEFKDHYNMWRFGLVLSIQDVVDGKDYVSIVADDEEFYTFKNKQIKRAKIRKVDVGDVPQESLETIDYTIEELE